MFRYDLDYGLREQRKNDAGVTTASEVKKKDRTKRDSVASSEQQ
jgi:hypothetical protein